MQDSWKHIEQQSSHNTNIIHIHSLFVVHFYSLFCSPDEELRLMMGLLVDWYQNSVMVSTYESKQLDELNTKLIMMTAVKYTNCLIQLIVHLFMQHFPVKLVKQVAIMSRIFNQNYLKGVLIQAHIKEEELRIDNQCCYYTEICTISIHKQQWYSLLVQLLIYQAHVY